MLLRRSAKGAAAGNTAEPGPNEAKPAGPPVPDERDAIIKRLEQTIAEERKNSATLRETVDNLRFKTETLERSYAKQLADARQRGTSAEQALAEHNAQIAAFGAGREETIRLLTEARTELEQVKLDRDQLRQQLARGTRGNLDRSPLASPGADSPVGEGTINQLIANPSWLTKKEAAGAGSHLDAKVSAEQEPPPIEMIAPDLVFTKGRDDEDDDA
jgi:flagellar biosynthesis chaperone FliJ